MSEERLNPPAADGRVALARRALAPLPVGYHNLFDRLVAVAQRDDRIEAMWLGGSVARQAADAGSDLDVLVAVSDDAVDAFSADWRGWLESVTPVLLARQLPGMRGFFATTGDCLRVDVVIEPASAIPQTPYRTRLVVVDKAGLTGLVPPPERRNGPVPERIAAIVEEFFRQQVIFPAAVVVREDWLLGVVGVHETQLLLYQLFAACNEPLPDMGVKQWSAKLHQRQRDVLAELAQPQANRVDVITAMHQVRAAFRTSGRDTVRGIGQPWPDDIDRAVASYWASEGLGAPAAPTSPPGRRSSGDP